MPELPKIVRERLKISTSTLAHPDANVLTAFAEHALPEPEHALVLEHLARCGDCRDVMVLALPAIDTVQVTSSPSTSRSWLTWPVLRWGVVAAGVVVAVSLGILRYQQAHSVLRMASVARNEAVDRGAQKSSAAPSPAQTQPLEERDTSAKAPVTVKSLAADGAGNSGGTSQQLERNAHGRFTGTLADKVTTTVELGSRSNPDAKIASGESSRDLDLHYAYPPKTPPQIAANHAPAAGVFRKSVPRPQRQDATVSVEAKSQAEEVTIQEQTRDELAQNRSPDARDAEVAKAKPPVTMQDAAASAPSPTPPGVSAQQVVMLRALAPRWTISTSGALQRSLDEGKTWQEVNVNSPLAGDRNFFVAREAVTMPDAKLEARAKARETGKETGTEKDKSLVFRAVTAIGSQVWAGGSGGALYHSFDAGDHWTRVVPSASGVMLTGDVIGVEFSDTAHGKVTTSSPEVWTTTDGGVNWLKQ